MAGGVQPQGSAKQNQVAVPGSRFWGAVALIWLVIRFSEPEKGFRITDYLFIMMIVINSANAIREIIHNKRIAAGQRRAE